MPRSLLPAIALAALVSAAVLVRPGADPAAGKAQPKPPKPVPGYYLTASSAGDLERQAYDSAARFAKTQGPGHALLALDFGAARKKGDDYGTALRGGTFFSNDEIGDALQEAVRGYHDNYRQGDVTIVYANSNALLGDPGSSYEAFDEDTAHEAGEEQAKVATGLDLEDHVSATVGGDIEPGYDRVGSTEIPKALVAGAVEGTDGGSYYDFGTAPCDDDGKCVNGWTIDDICEVASGGGRQAVPEIYFDKPIDQPAQWAEVQKKCEIKAFPGVSASPLGRLTPTQSYRALGAKVPVEVDPVIVVFPG